MSDSSEDYDDIDEREYDSGPFCEHWSDPSDWESLCKCGHKCCEHFHYESDSSCKDEGCNCEQFENES